MTNEYLWRKLKEEYHIKRIWIDYLRELLVRLVYSIDSAVYYLSL